MTAALDYETADTPGLAQLERMLQIGRGRNLAVINAPVDSALRLMAVSRANPYDADVVIAFATRRKDLARIKAAYHAAGAGRTVWVVYAEPGRPGTDLRWQWFLAALRQYGVQAVQQVAVDGSWSAVQLQRMREREAASGLVSRPENHF